MKKVNEFKWQFNRLVSRCKQINNYTIAILLKLNLKQKGKCCDMEADKKDRIGAKGSY